MKIKRIFSYLVFPGKNQDDTPEILSADVPLIGKLFSMLKDVFDKSREECDIPIRFRMGDDGSQNNDMREKIVQILQRNNIKTGQHIAEMLRDCTTNKSGLGLFFIILGKDDNSRQILLSRFPAEQGILADSVSDSLRIEFIERIFMKNAKMYKSAVYYGSSFDSDFWDGIAIDKQIYGGARSLANYWVRDFLISDFKTTSKAGTRRLAKALMEAIKDAPTIELKEKLVAAATLASAIDGQPISIKSFTSKYGLPEEAEKLIVSKLPSSHLADDQFRFDLEEFRNFVRYKSIELDHGGILTAQVERFDKCFQREELSDPIDGVRFSTQGKIVNEKLKGRS